MLANATPIKHRIQTSSNHLSNTRIHHLVKMNRSGFNNTIPTRARSFLILQLKNDLINQQKNRALLVSLDQTFIPANPFF